MLGGTKKALLALCAKAGYVVLKRADYERLGKDAIAAAAHAPDGAAGADADAGVLACVGERLSAVTDTFWQRVGASTLAEFERLAGEAGRGVPDLSALTPLERRRETLRYGVHHLPDAFAADTGLTAFAPPDDVHAMVRETVYCGDFYYGDLVTEALARAGRAVEPGRPYLDFGCSSGRVVRNLSLAYPEARFCGCDPNPGAVDWAARNIDNVTFSQSPRRPPTDFPDGRFAAVYAISIWSHFGARQCRLWLDEMRRILEPGGLLVWTTHGVGALRYYFDGGAMSAAAVAGAERALARDGFYFIDVFGEQGDWGLDAVEWGQSFISPQYVIQNLLDGWALLDYAPRRAEGNQDVYVFEKR